MRPRDDLHMRVVAAIVGALIAAGAAHARVDAEPAVVSTCAQPPRTPAVDTDPAWSTTGERIAFIRRDGRSSRLFVAAADGSAPRAAFAATASPSWFPDGRIAYEWNGAVWIVAAHGAQSDRLLDDARAPAASPDGSRLAFVRDGLIWTADVNAFTVTNMRPVSTKASTFFPHVDSDPAWSPDGRRIAYTRDAGVDRGGIDVWVVGADGTGAAKVTNNDMFNAEPSWSPDGTRIAFQTWTPNTNAAIHTARVDGSEERSLTLNTNFAFDAYRVSPAWSSRGEIAFEAFRYENRGGTWGSELRAVRPDGRSERRLTYHCQFNGGDGASATINGTALADRVYGYAGDDRIRGYRGDDRLYGGAEDDLVDGGFDDDRVDGALGNDVLVGGTGNDVLLAKDGQRDRLDCGPGRDVAHADRLDLVSRTCERVFRSLPQPRR